jgi:DNA polymerase III epsilon subunit-like protein
MYAAIDCETTGLDGVNCQILAFHCILDNLVDPIDQLPSFNYLFHWDQFWAEPKAMVMNHALLKRISDGEGKKPEQFAETFIQFLYSHNWPSPLVVAAKNPRFDVEFLEEYEIPIHYRLLDPTMYSLRKEDPKPPSLRTCLERNGIDPTGLHTETRDALAIVQLMRKHLLAKPFSFGVTNDQS